MQDYRNLKVWQKSHQVALAVYSATEIFPKSELYGLTSQLRRAAYSVPANLAEGCGRQSSREFARSLYISMGSACEVEYFLLLSRDLTFLAPDHYDQLVAKVCEVKRMLAALIAAARTRTGPKPVINGDPPRGEPH